MGPHFCSVFLAIILMARKAVSGDEGVSANLALNRKTGWSTILNGQTAGRKAVDGRVDDTVYTMHFGTGVETVDPDPYWYVELDGLHLVQTVEVISRMHCCLDHMQTIEVRVGKELNGDGGRTNPLCGQPTDMSALVTHTFRCEIYGKFVTVKKTNIPVKYHLIFLEVMVNKEPTENIAYKKPTDHSSSYSPTRRHSSNAVDGILNSPSLFATGSVKGKGDKILPHWLMIDFKIQWKVHKIVVVPLYGNLPAVEKIILTIGDNATDAGKHNARIGDVHDFSTKARPSTVYVLPRKAGRYFYLQSLLATDQMHIVEVQIYSESMPYITQRSYGPHDHVFYEGHVAVLNCDVMGYPRPYVAWLSDGVLIQNKTTDTALNLTIHDAAGSKKTYECYASNIHGKDYLPITFTVAGRYDMCIRPEEIRDPSRNVHSKKDKLVSSKSDADTFNATKMYYFFNPQTLLHMKLASSCPSPSSCGTDAPGWMVGEHPKPEDGIVRRKVCFHYNGDCCYKFLYVSVIDCPGMYVYSPANPAKYTFPARYCFADDKNYEAFAPFKSVPRQFNPAGGMNTALANHVITKAHGIDNTVQCFVVCMMNKCRSFNFDKIEKVCEVNDATRDEYPRDLSIKSGSQYYHPMAQLIVIKMG